MITRNKKLRAFTLLEILIATGIFSTILVLATGIVGQSASNQEKLKAERLVTDQTTEIASELSQAVRDADSVGKVVIDKTVPGIAYPYGMALFNCISVCSPINDTGRGVYAADKPVSDSANTMIIFRKNSAGVIENLIFNSYYAAANKTSRILYRKVSGDQIGLQAPSGVSLIDIIRRMRNGTDLTTRILAGASTATPLDIENDVTAYFAGFAPNETATAAGHLSPFVEFSVEAKTRGYADLSASRRAKTIVRSLVTSRKVD